MHWSQIRQSRLMNLETIRKSRLPNCQPMGVATYKTADEIDEEVLQVLPPKEQLQALLEQR